MAVINTKRWFAGGIAAGAVLWLLDGVASILYLNQMQAAMTAHGLAMAADLRTFLLSLAVSLIGGLATVFFYILARNTLGPGPRTAIVVAVALWVGGYVVSLIGFDMMGLFPQSLLLTWALVALVERILASLVGAWIYRDR